MISLSLVLQQSATKATEWFEFLVQSDSARNIDLLGLAESAAFNATNPLTETSKAERISWALLAERVYYLYAEHSTQDDALAVIESSVMTMRSNLIARYGEDVSTPLLDISVIERWCCSALKQVTQEELEQGIKDWTVLPVDVLRPLRKLKNRLSICEYLSGVGRTIKSEEIKRLLTIKDKLP